MVAISFRVAMASSTAETREGMAERWEVLRGFLEAGEVSDFLSVVRDKFPPAKAALVDQNKAGEESGGENRWVSIRKSRHGGEKDLQLSSSNFLMGASNGGEDFVDFFLRSRKVYERAEAAGVALLRERDPEALERFVAAREAGEVSPYVFANRYDPDEVHGLAPHVDDCHHFTVVVVMTDDDPDEGSNLWIETRAPEAPPSGCDVVTVECTVKAGSDGEGETKRMVPMLNGQTFEAGDALAMLPNTFHLVQEKRRKKERTSLNIFF
jgi:hypothetical protein